ncbi:MAG: DNA polymerase III subunit beta [Deltaproteobacteria bacterium RIFCSPLOWO2_02_FULL_44_10]|nr:MAG: DNA polymerase III subunit beta [Deltaproteobacteria bacterium RIFCSPHIGHO2_02_FULL_44_16]OGQ45440.1 MAG: DNA polymerase III subunit beta [Deltaproteobacteria bacterium RIFCSPLOWO2_02_FULL_44_10]
MELKIDRAALVRELHLVQGIVERKTTMPILANVLLEAKKKKLITTATDLEVGVTSSVEADVTKEGRVTVHARGLYDIVKELPEETIHLTVNDKNWIHIQCGRSDFKIVGLAADEFPALPQKGDGAAASLPITMMLEMIEKTAFAMSNDETRYNLNGIMFEHEKGKKIRMVATDGHRLSIAERPCDANMNTFPASVIIPRKGVMELKRLIEGKEGSFELFVDAKHAILHQGKVTLTIRLIDGQFPPYKQVIPKESRREVGVNRETIVQALRRVGAMSSERTRGVRFAFSPKNLEISSNNPDFGEAHEELSANYRGESFAIGFNARYVLDALSVLEDEEAKLKLGDDTAPCVVTSEFDKGFTHIIMPMRI